MSWYSEYRNEWKEIIETVARECKRAELMVEKDTVQSMFLLDHELTVHDLDLHALRAAVLLYHRS